LEALAPEHEIARALLEHRTITKLRSTYCEALPRLVDPQSGRIHTTFHQTVASTGRLSSSDPNLQNIPIRSDLGRRIRAAFVPGDARSVLVSADYSQIELRVLAHLSGDAALRAALQGDVHTTTAARIAGCAPEEVTPAQRAAAKAVNFGVVYGMGARGLADRLGIPIEEARRFIDEYFASYPDVHRLTRSLVEKAHATGEATTILGRRLALPDLGSANPGRRAAAERVAVNAPIQGSAADLIKMAMVRVHGAIAQAGLRARLVLQVHDELVFDAPESELEELRPIVRDAMCGALPLAVPLVVEIGAGRNWAEAH
jgi:DNA polymerase-1